MLAAVLVAAFPSLGTGARLEGRVRLAPSAATPTLDAGISPYAGMMGSIPKEASTGAPRSNDPRDVVVALTGVATVASAPAPVAHPRIAQVNQTFQPRVLAVPVGTTVEFPNLDPIFHNVFSYSKAKRFDLGKYGKDKSAHVTFDQAGLVRVFCDIHSNMTAYVYVTETPWVVQPDAEGRFTLGDVPPGEYTLQLWHPDRGSRTETVTVPVSGAHIDLQF